MRFDSVMALGHVAGSDSAVVNPRGEPPSQAEPVMLHSAPFGVWGASEEPLHRTGSHR
jgi:hypothetical protein